MRTILLTLLVATLAQAQPWQPVVIWDRSGAGEHSHFGAQVYSLGDQNNDGNADFAVLSGSMAAPGQDSEPRFDLFHGGNPPETTPYMTFAGNASPTRELFFGEVIGDVNGDGYADWWTLYYLPAEDTTEVNIHYGGPAADTVADVVFHIPATSWDGVDPVGDINGDGYADFYFYNGGGGGLLWDRTFFFFGGNPLDTIPDMVIHSNPRGSQSAQPRACGDINGDGYGDFLTSNNYITRTTYIFLGGDPPDTLPDYVWPDFRVDRVIISSSLNGDQAADLVVGRSLRMDVHFGGLTLSPTPNCTLTFPDCDLGPTEMDYAGDFNGDGYGDLAAISDCNLGFGALRLYLGHPWLNPDPVVSIDGGELPLDLIGICHATGLGDVNGDGIEDLAIGATNEMTYHQGQRGRVVILSGDTTLRVGLDDFRPEIPRELSVSVFPNPFNSSATVSLQVPPGANQVELATFNLLGQLVRRFSIRVAPGVNIFSFDGHGLSSGVYFLHVQAGSVTNTQKLMVLR